MANLRRCGTAQPPRHGRPDQLVQVWHCISAPAQGTNAGTSHTTAPRATHAGTSPTTAPRPCPRGSKQAAAQHGQHVGAPADLHMRGTSEPLRAHALPHSPGKLRSNPLHKLRKSMGRAQRHWRPWKEGLRHSHACPTPSPCVTSTAASAATTATATAV